MPCQWPSRARPLSNYGRDLLRCRHAAAACIPDPEAGDCVVSIFSFCTETDGLASAAGDTMRGTNVTCTRRVSGALSVEWHGITASDILVQMGK